MVASITFRLKSSNHIGTIDMDGSVMSCRDAQQAIAAKLCATPEEINIFLADSTSLLHPDEDLHAYDVVDVVRQTYSGKPHFLPRPKPSTLPMSMDRNGPMGANAGNSGMMGGGNGGVDSDLSSMGGQPPTEEERLAQLQAKAALDTGVDEVSSRMRRGGRGAMGGRGGRGMGDRGGAGGGHGGGGAGRGNGTTMQNGGTDGANGGGDNADFFFGGGRGDAIRANMEENFRPPPKGYICHNCGKGGHLIQHCPSAKDGKAMKVLSFPVGIPESMLVECTMDDPAPKFITRDHRLVKRRVDPSVFTAISIAGVGNSEKDESDHLFYAEALAQEAANANAGEDSTKEKVGSSGLAGATTTAAPGGSSNPTAISTPMDKKYLCIVDHVVAREAMRMPCCGGLMCSGCFTKMADEAFDEARSLDDEDDVVVCPSCGEPLMMDEVLPATEEREQIRELLLARKREREA